MDIPEELVQELHNITETLLEVKEEQLLPKDGSNQLPPKDSRNLLGLCPVFLIVLMIVLRVSWTLYKSFEPGSMRAPGHVELGAETSDEGPRAVQAVSPAVVAYLSIFLTVLVMSFVLMCVKMAHIRQKTRNPPQRRMYAGSRQRPSLTAQEPTIYVSPSNFPPPPKYECMAPPSYEEVVGIHYPSYQIQPISQPINEALAQTSSNNTPPTTTTTEPVVSTVNELSSPAAPAATISRHADVTVVR